MRKYHLSRFNKETEYIKKKRTKDAFFYHSCLIEYAKKFIIKNEGLINISKYNSHLLGLVFFLGSIFYPKEMSINVSDKEIKKAINSLHKSLYTFSIKVLDSLYEWTPYRVLLHHFLDK